MRASLTFSLIFLLIGTLVADEQVRRVQEELRKRNLYFGDIDGQKSKETSGAIRRYQERKGFVATGELDADTVRSLQLAPSDTASTISAAPWPDVPVLKSDAAREIAESDRKLLETITNPAEPPPAVAEPPAAVQPPAPQPPVPQPQAAQPPPPQPAPPTDADGERITERAKTFVRDYLQAAETNKLDAEMSFYADRVNYFDHGNVTREFIERDVRRYYKRWPQRDYELLDFKLTKAAGNDVEVKFRISFEVKNPEHRVTGKTNNIFKIRRTGDEMRFVSLKEQRLRE